MADRDVVSEFSCMFQNVIRLLDTVADAKDLKEYLSGFRDGNGEPYFAPSLYSDCMTTEEILKSLRPQYIHYMHLHLLQNIVEHYGIDESKALVQQYDENFPRSVPLKLLPHPLSEEEIQACHCVAKLVLQSNRDYDKFNKVELESIEGTLRSQIGISQLAFVYVYAISASGSVVLTFLIPQACASAFTDTTDPRFLHLFNEAMKDGYVEAQIVKCLFIGAAGAGKTNTIYLLFGWPPPPDRHSTGCIDPIRAVSCIKACSDGEVWTRVDSTKLCSLLAGNVSDSIASFSGAMYEALGKATTGETSGESAIVSPPAYTETGAAIAREMSKLSKIVPDGGKLQDVKWIYLIDSGGQSQFHRVLSAFLKDTSAGVFVLNLSEELSDHPLMELYDHGTRRGESHRSPLTNEEIFRSCIQTVQSLPYTAGGGNVPNTFVIGTHQDKEMPGTRARKNEQLLKILVPTEGCKESSFHGNIVYSSDLSKKEVIHAVNARSREKPDTDIAQELRSKIEHLDSLKKEIPRRWYALELEIERFAAAKHREIVTWDECVNKIGERLHVQPNEVKAALVHLGDLNIFLYYPNVLPNIVFTSPCVLLNKIRNLVQKSYELKGHCPSGKAHEATEGMWFHFCDRGIITYDILGKLSDAPDDEYLTSQQLVRLFEHLLIVAPISETEFFMPALLDQLKPEEIVRPSSEYASAYIISFPNGYAPCGLCSALVACLCSSEHNPRPWAFATSSRSGKLYGNRITFSVPSVIASVTLIDSGSYFEVYVNIKTRPSLRSSRYRSACPQVRQTIDDCLMKAITVRNFQHVKSDKTILCQCKDIICQCDTNSCQCEAGTIEPHPARLVIDTYPYFWQCPYDTSISDTLVDKELVWFPEPTPVEQPSRDISLHADAVPGLSQVSCSNATASPDIILTHVNKSRIVHYLDRIGSNQDLLRLGEGLGLDGSVLRRKVNSDISLDDMVREWLERKHNVDEVGKPSWRVLIRILRDVGQNGLANDIEKEELTN